MSRRATYATILTALLLLMTPYTVLATDSDGDGTDDADDDYPDNPCADTDTDGDGICNDGDATENGELTLSFGEAGQMHIDIDYVSTNPIGGYQFQLNDEVNLTGAHDTFGAIIFNWENGGNIERNVSE